MQHFRYTEAEIAELCKIPPWTDSALDKHARQIHAQVPVTRKCIVNQCLFWCDVAQRFKRNLHGRRRTQAPEPFDAQGGAFVVGVIGCGAIGSKLVRELLQRGTVEAAQVRVSSRTPSRAKQRCGVEAVANNAEVAAHCTVLFLCVLPYHFRAFAREIRDTVQRARPLVVSTLAGYTQAYLQRALGTRFDVSTAVDLPTDEAAAGREADAFPLACFATGREMRAFQEFFSGSDVPAEAPPDEDAPEPSPAATARSDDLPRSQSDEPDAVANPFQVRLTDEKVIRHLHQAAFAAENLSNCRVANLNALIAAIREWVASDSNHAKIETRPVTYERLWARSFIPLPCIERLALVEQRGLGGYEKPVRFLLKRAFVRSLVPEVAVEGAETSSAGEAFARTARLSERPA
jgi:hypothetical protein